MSFQTDLICYSILNKQLFNPSICHVNNNSQCTTRSLLLSISIGQADACRLKQVPVGVYVSYLHWMHASVGEQCNNWNKFDNKGKWSTPSQQNKNKNEHLKYWNISFELLPTWIPRGYPMYCRIASHIILKLKCTCLPHIMLCNKIIVGTFKKNYYARTARNYIYKIFHVFFFVIWYALFLS